MARFTGPSAWQRDLDHVASGDGPVTLAQFRGSNDDDHLVGLRKADTIEGRGGDDVLLGRLGDDVLDGGNGNDVLRAGAGSDQLYGGAGSDRLRGGTVGQEHGRSGIDHLDGGKGNDRLVGGVGGDDLVGGAGKDRFIYNRLTDSTVSHSDTIADFEQGRDTLVFRDQFRSSDPLHFIGDAPFSHSYGEVRFEIGNGHSAVLVDLDGNGQAEFRIDFTSEVRFQAADFSF